MDTNSSWPPRVNLKGGGWLYLLEYHSLFCVITFVLRCVVIPSYFVL